MTGKEMDDFLEAHQEIRWAIEDDKKAIRFRNVNLQWYKEDENAVTRITMVKLDQLTTNELLMAINKGLDVEQITRVTGYFGKVKSFNPGKIGELVDRKTQIRENRSF